MPSGTKVFDWTVPKEWTIRAGYLREVMGLRPAPEFEAWLAEMGIAAPDGRLRALSDGASPFVRRIAETMA